MFFLLMACSQFIPFLRIGLIYTYWGPLCFVTFVTMCREGFDDFRRFQRDREVNSSRYSKLTQRGKVSISSAEIKVRRIYFHKLGIWPQDLCLDISQLLCLGKMDTIALFYITFTCTLSKTIAQLTLGYSQISYAIWTFFNRLYL